MNYIESCRIVWRCKRARGPDVEQVFLLPVAVAVESKRTAADALDGAGQVIDYALSGKYDAVFLRLESPPEDGNRDFSRLKSVIRAYGVGIIVGANPYSPLTDSQAVLQRARISLNSDPLELIKDMGCSARTLEAPLSLLSSLRKCFEVSSYER